MNAKSNGASSPLSILLSVILGLIAAFFGFGGVGFAVVSLAAVAGRATAGELATIIGISAFSFAVVGICIFAILSLHRRS
ncbi:hypothetical protein EON80_16735 [bacterium]|nr:MAG: hypothetical protein EON80_16735 [bacterium]